MEFELGAARNQRPLNGANMPEVRRFARLAARYSKPARVRFTWCGSAPDRTVAGVDRFDRFDWTTNVVADLYPHVLSILQAVLGPCSIEPGTCDVRCGGWEADLTVRFDDVPVAVSLSRLGPHPQRSVELTIPGEGVLELDFTRVPTVVTMDGEPVAVGGEANAAKGPLPVGHDALLMPSERDRSSLDLEVTEPLRPAVLHAVDVAAESQRHLIRDSVARHQSGIEPVRALAEVIVPKLLDLGAFRPDDEAAIERWCHAGMSVISALAENAFTRQRDLAADAGIDRHELVTLNAALRSSPFVREMVTEAGAAAKYWTNTVIPLQRAGVVDDVITGRPRYPFRVGIYPGPSCMFFCTFCGRNYSARYDRSSIPRGNALITRMFEQAPNDDPDTFYISGGLEPLTNPGLGELITAGRRCGFRLSLYTNGLMLTPATLRRQPGLWDLESVRVSLYGVDPETFQAVTRKSNAFQHVIANVKSFLALRARRDSSIRLGFNYVVLPGQQTKLLELCDLIAEINRDGGGRPLDYLTLREDFSVPNGGFDGEGREQLRSALEAFHHRLTSPDLVGLTVDYGYGLDALRRGFDTTRLCFVSDDEIRPDGYPQVSVVVDLLGDVYLYKEAGFIERPGANRYIIGRLDDNRDLSHVVTDYIESGVPTPVETGDTRFFDAFDHVVTSLLRQAADDVRYGIPLSAGPVEFSDIGSGRVVLAHPTLPTNLDLAHSV